MSSMTATSRGVPALDLKAQYATIKDEIDRAIASVVTSQMFVLGPEVAALESEVAAYCRAARGIGCASGSDALLLPLLAWDIGPGDEVVTTPYSFFATAGAIWRTGARPVFVDIEHDSYNLDPRRLRAALTPKTKAILPVHLYGQSADMAAINEIARSAGIPVLEDAAQAIGAKFREECIGTIGDAAAFSFYPSKNLGGFGDGGMVTTNDEALANRVARLRVHGMEPRYVHHEIGFNSRLDALQAAVLRVKLRYLDAWTEARRTIAQRYHGLIEEHKINGTVIPPLERPGCHHVYNQYVVRVPAHLRDPLRSFLSERKIGTEIYYPIPLHLQACFASLGHATGDFPESENAAKQTIALPIYPELSESDQRAVVEAIADFLASRPANRLVNGFGNGSHS